MASLGMISSPFNCLGCWGSDGGVRYVAEVPLSAVTKRVIDYIQTASSKEVAQGEQLSLFHKLKGVDIDGDMTSDLRIEMNRSKDQLTSIRRSEAKRFVANEDSRVVHIPTSCSGPTWTWSTRCGRALVRAKAAVLRTDPDLLWPHAGEDSGED